MSNDLSLYQRVRRRLLCAQVTRRSNVDLFRFRAELNAGMTAEEKIREVENATGRIDVLHFHRQGTAYRSLARMKRVPSIVSIDGTQSMFSNTAASSIAKLSYAPGVRRDGRVFAAAKLIVSASDWAAACLRNEYPECKTEIVVRPNPTDLGVFSDKLAHERHARSAKAATRVNLLFVGGDFERKGGPELLEAWELGRFSESATLTIVTSEDVTPRQHAGVVWLSAISPHTDEWLNVWHRADIFVMPTREEPFGNVFQEASAAGLPSIGTRVNAIPDRIIDGETGLLIRSRDVSELVRALRTLVESPDIRHRMGIAARRHVEKTADPVSYANFLTTSIRRLAKQTQ